jgi:apolipoprotein N-acyltransferase
MAFAAGLATSLAFPPVGVWPIAFIGVAPLLVLLRDRTVPRGLLLGFCFGVGLFGATLYWIFLFGALAWSALVTLSAASIAVFGAIATLIVRRDRLVWGAIGIAAAWTAIDWLRGMWPLGGFTWANLGTSQVDYRALVRLASVTGVWGVTFVVVFANAAVAAWFVRQGRAGARIALVIAAVAAILAPALIPLPAATGDPVTIAVVQIDVRVPSDTSPVQEDLTVARRNIEEYLTLAGQTPPPDLAVWGEGALDPGALADPATVADVRSAIAKVGVPTTVGAVVSDPDGTQRTSVLAFDASGTLVDRYDKVHLVPFGEYVPWRRHLSWINAIKQIPVDRTPGSSVHTITQPGLPTYGTPICFENAFPDIERTMAREGAQFFVVPVNNASYGFTAAADQHLEMSRMRAVETGRWVVDAGVAGISAFIDTDGQVISHTQLFVPGILRGQVRPSTAWTLYVRYGDWFPVVCLVIVAMSLLFAPRRRTTRPTPGPLPDPLRGLAVLPTYEERGTIDQAIRGVLATAGIDVLVIDDSSPDGTGELVAAIADTEPRVRLLERPSRWIRTCRTTRRSCRCCSRPPNGTTWSSGAGTSPVARSRTGAGRGSPCRGAGTRTRDSCSGSRSMTPPAATASTAVSFWRISCAIRSRPTAMGSRSSSSHARTGSATTSAKRRSRSGNASTASPRSPRRSWSRLCGRSPGGAGIFASTHVRPPERAFHTERP